MLRNLRLILMGVGGIVAAGILAVATTAQAQASWGGNSENAYVAIGAWNSNANVTGDFEAAFKVVNPSDGGALSAGPGSPTYVCANVYFFSDVTTNSAPASNFPLLGCGACNVYEFGSLEFRESGSGETPNTVANGHVYIVTSLPNTGGESGCDATNGNQTVVSPGLRAWTVEDQNQGLDPHGLSLHEFEQAPLTKSFYKALAANCKAFTGTNQFTCYNEDPLP